MKRQIVDKLTNEGTPLSEALKVAELPSSSYYYRTAGKRKSRAPDEGLVAAISAVRSGRNEVYGYRKVTRALQAGGKAVNGKKGAAPPARSGPDPTQKNKRAAVDAPTAYQTG